MKRILIQIISVQNNTKFDQDMFILNRNKRYSPSSKMVGNSLKFIDYNIELNWYRLLSSLPTIAIYFNIYLNYYALLSNTANTKAKDRESAT